MTQMWLSIPTMMQDNGPGALSESRAFFTSGVLRECQEVVIICCFGTRERYTMENSVLSKWHTVLTPPCASSPSSGHVSPSRALFCVVAKTGMFKIWPAFLNQHSQSAYERERELVRGVLHLG